ncbi:MAG: lipopolysaccharide heptosyltransferase II [Gemmatimonadetes bacterium]|nr:lipopolysaccharide heptosyltransferase II [Gemmatimonadota bacterium]
MSTTTPAKPAGGLAVVVQTAFLGDVVLTTPLLAALAERHGPVDVVTTSAAAPLIETHPAVRRVIPYEKKGKDRGLRGLATLARTLRAERYEVAYLPHRSLRTAALALLARIPRRVGFHDGWPLFYTEVKRRPAEGHEIDRLLALVGLPSGAYTPRLYPTPEDERAAAAVLAAAGITDDFVVLAPGSIWGSKRWPYYPQLAERLARRMPIVAVGGPEDAALGDEILQAVRRHGGAAVNACGSLSLRASAALIAKARLLVTNDSAPLHLASAMGTPVVAIFGPTIPDFGFGPVRPQDLTLGVAGLPCRPCSRHGPPRCPLGHHRCMKALFTDSVHAYIEETGALRRRD